MSFKYTDGGKVFSERIIYGTKYPNVPESPVKGDLIVGEDGTMRIWMGNNWTMTKECSYGELDLIARIQKKLRHDSGQIGSDNTMAEETRHDSGRIGDGNVVAGEIK